MSTLPLERGMRAEPAAADSLITVVGWNAGTASYIRVALGIESAATPLKMLMAPYQEAAMRTYFQNQDVRRREEVAREFAERALAVPGVREVRLTAADDELAVTALTEDRDMERDLRLHALFLDATSDLGDHTRLRILVFEPTVAADAGTLLT